MDTSLTEQIRTWFERSPKARRAYKRLGADLDAAAAWVESATRGGLRDAVAARIDPPGGAPTPAQDAGEATPERPSSEAPAITAPAPPTRGESPRAQPPSAALDA
jgi:hypothetical protein